MTNLRANNTQICYDTEFHDDGTTIDLISIGLVDADRRWEYYAVNADCDFERIREHDWLWANVVPHLPTTKTDWTNPKQDQYITRLDLTAACVKPKWVIANEIRDLILRKSVGKPELWAYYGAYDHVALAQLWGPMSKLPEGIPMWTHDLMQLWERHPDVKKPIQTEEHDALADANWNLRLLRALQESDKSE